MGDSKKAAADDLGTMGRCALVPVIGKTCARCLRASYSTAEVKPGLVLCLQCIHSLAAELWTVKQPQKWLGLVEQLLTFLENTPACEVKRTPREQVDLDLVREIRELELE